MCCVVLGLPRRRGVEGPGALLRFVVCHRTATEAEAQRHIPFRVSSKLHCCWNRLRGRRFLDGFLDGDVGCWQVSVHCVAGVRGWSGDCWCGTHTEGGPTSGPTDPTSRDPAKLGGGESQHT